MDQKTTTFVFCDPEAINIAYIVKRNETNRQLIHKMLVWASTMEELLQHPKPDAQ